MSTKSPFDHGLFFSYSGHNATLEALRKGVAEGTSLITCIGAEGYGKTLLCRTLENDFSSSLVVISFPYSVESFDYVLQIVALKLKLEFSIEENALGGVHLLMKISAALRDQKKRLLILFDEAEKLYLATLERIRKMIDLVNNGDEILLQIVLFGRAGLQPHIEQLALCTFKETQELHLLLPSVTAEEVFQYVQFCMQQSPDMVNKDAFSREVAIKIFTLSQGNFRKINKLAVDALRLSSLTVNNSVGVVALEHVVDSEHLVTVPPRHRRVPLPMPAKGTMLGAGAVFMVILLFFFFSHNRKQTAPKMGKTVAKEIQKTTDTLPQSPVSVGRGADIAKPAVPSVSLPLTSSLPAPSLPISSAPVIEAPPPASPAPSVEENKVVPSPPSAPAEAVATVSPPPPPAPALVLPDVTPGTKAPAVPTKPAVPVENVPVVVRRQAPEPQALIAEKLPKKKNVVPHLTSESVIKKQGPTTQGAEQLSQKSIAAGEQWRNGKNNDLYTLQLMVLVTDRAEEKLKTILQDEKERKGGQGLVLLKKATTPATFTLFYGEFPTLAEAKAAQAALPPSLQKFNPYPVTVKRAVEKSKR